MAGSTGRAAACPAIVESPLWAVPAEDFRLLPVIEPAFDYRGPTIRFSMPNCEKMLVFVCKRRLYNRPYELELNIL